MRFTTISAKAILLASLAAAPTAYGQSDEDKSDSHEMDTLVTTGNASHGGYGAPVVKVGNILKETAFFAGARGAWIVDHKYAVGLAGYGLTSDIDFPGDAKKRQLNLGYGGVIFEYTPYSDRLVHLHSSLLLGGGGVSLGHRKDEDEDKEEKSGPSDTFAVVEPELIAEVNVTEWLRLGIGASYLFTSRANLLSINDRTLSGARGLLTMRVGAF